MSSFARSQISRSNSISLIKALDHVEYWRSCRRSEYSILGEHSQVNTSPYLFPCNYAYFLLSSAIYMQSQPAVGSSVFSQAEDGCIWTGGRYCSLSSDFEILLHSPDNFSAVLASHSTIRSCWLISCKHFQAAFQISTAQQLPFENFIDA